MWFCGGQWCDNIPNVTKSESNIEELQVLSDTDIFYAEDEIIVSIDWDRQKNLIYIVREISNAV